MKSNILGVSLVAGLLLASVGTNCSAQAVKPGVKEIKPQVSAQTTPELQAAAERVKQTEIQLDTARKQLAAAKANLRAAEAEYKAAKADREALALRTEAQGLSDASGLKALAQAPTFAKDNKNDLQAQPPTSYGDGPGKRIQQLDFNAQPMEDATQPMPLR